jgi:tetratricopeptide (TPR) repeat protein
MNIVRGSIRIAVFLLFALAAVAIRVATSAKAELERADALLAEGDLDRSVQQYRRAARWYAPGSPYHVTALERLAALGAQAEAQGDTERALSAYRAIRAAILSSRSFYTPESGRLKEANIHIASLTASLRPASLEGERAREKFRTEHLALLEARSGPKLLWTWALLIGFIAWVGGAYVFTVLAIDAYGHLVWREVRLWGTVVILGLGLFILGLALA